MRWPTRLGVLLGLLALAGCAQKFGEDYCVAEKRQVPDREKMVRFFMRHDATGFEWQSQARGAPHFIQWMAREAPDPEDTDLAEEAIGRYLDEYPNFVQIVGRWPFVWGYGDNLYLDDLKSAIDGGYYADIVIMGSRNSDYPTFHEAATRSEMSLGLRRGITNCGNLIWWQHQGD